MSLWLELLAFAGVMALGQFSPGPDMLLLTRTALAEGGRAGVVMAWGIATGLAVHASLAVGGVAVVLERSEGLRRGLIWAAVMYLGWLAVGLIREFVKGVDDDAVTKGAGGAYRRGMLCNLLNPKAALFLAALSLPFLAGERPGWWPAALWAVIVFQGAILWSLWALALQWGPLKSLYQRAQRWIDLGFAVVLVLLAGRLALG